ncbi:MAG: hypothetical protein WCE65_03400 [Methanoregula sp.]
MDLIQGYARELSERRTDYPVRPDSPRSMIRRFPQTFLHCVHDTLFLSRSTWLNTVHGVR